MDFLDYDAAPKGLTHKQAVRRVANWLRVSKKFSVVMAEFTALTEEQPDVIGWKTTQSMLIEVKVSRADFLSDRHKSFRQHEQSGMGDQRYYAAPKGLLKPDEIPDGWGLLEIGEHQIRERKGAVLKEANKRAEVQMLVSSFRRLELATAVFVRHEADEPAAASAPALEAAA